MGKSKSTGDGPRLTEAQRELVRANIGLVAVHLKRHVTNLVVPQRDREYDDLFQEGCLGLMRSAVRWDPASGIPFAAFALPRIHNAVSLALKCKFATIYVPPRRPKKASSPTQGDPPAEATAPRTRSLTHGQWQTLADAPIRTVGEGPRETIGDRVREMFEWAVRRSESLLKSRPSVRGDRDRLIQLIVRERLLVPQPESQRSLRQIARDTASSYARVAQCAAQLTEGVRHVLGGNPEFRELLRQARTHHEGYAAPIDASIDRAAASAAADECVRQFRSGDEHERATLLYTVARHSKTDLGHFLRRAVERMSREQRQGLLGDSLDRDVSRGATSRHRAARTDADRSCEVRTDAFVP